MSWTEVSSDRYERPCDAAEEFLTIYANIAKALDREHWTITTTARLETGQDLTDILPQAWLHTRHFAPMIACLVADKNLTYEVPDEKAQSDWLAETYAVESGTVDDFLLRVRPTRYCTLHYFPGSSEVVIRLHHWLMDGSGALSLLNVLLDRLAAGQLQAPKFGDEWKRLPPSQHEAAGFPDEITPAIEQHAQEIFTKFVLNLPSVGLSIEAPPPSKPLGGIKRYIRNFDKATSASFVSACKAANATVTTAVEAAIIVATQEYASPATQGRNYTQLAAFALRPVLRAPYNDHKTWPTGYYVAGIPYSLPPADFQTQLRQLGDVYRQPIREGKGQLFDSYETYMKMMLAPLSAPPPPDMPPPTTPGLSSLGKVDEAYVQSKYSGKHEIELLGVDIAVDLMIPEIRLYAWTFREELHVSVVWNEVFYTGQFIQDFLGQVLEILSQELKVSLA